MKNTFPRIHFIGIGCFILLMAATAVSAQPEFPNTPSGRRAREVLELMNKGDAKASEEYVENFYSEDFKNAFPMSQHIGLFTMMNRQFGELRLNRIENTADYSIEFFLKSTISDAGLKIVIDVESSAPYKIARMGVMPAGGAPPPSNTEEPGGRASQNAMNAQASPPGSVQDVPFSTWKEMDAVLVEKTGKNEFSGVVLVAKDGNPVFEKAYGLASKNYNVPNRIDTKFNLASLGKWFTSVSITQLAEAGKIHFDDPIGMYLMDFPKKAAEKVTIRHLLQMRSGWGDYWQNETYLNKWSTLRTVQDYIAFLKDLPLEFEPGTQMIHSNTSFIVLGAIVEAVTGQDFDTYVREHILKPAGMADTTPCAARDEPIENVATGYTNQNPYDPEKTGYRWSNVYFMAASGTPAGGGYSTAGDLLAFSNALRNHVLLSANHTNYLLNNFRGAFEDATSKPSRMPITAGATYGANTFFALDFTEGHTIIVLSNYDMPAAMDLGREIIRMLGLS